MPKKSKKLVAVELKEVEISIPLPKLLSLQEMETLRDRLLVGGLSQKDGFRLLHNSMILSYTCNLLKKRLTAYFGGKADKADHQVAEIIKEACGVLFAALTEKQAPKKEEDDGKLEGAGG